MRDSMIDPRELMDITLRVAGQTAGLLRDYSELEGLEEIVGKQPLGDTTRKIDVIAEEYLIELIRNEGLNSLVVTEERGIIRVGSGDPEYVFIVDPLDGSSNYLSKIPWSAVSVAVAPCVKKNLRFNDIIAGTVAPIQSDLLPVSFAKGYGVFRASSRIRHVKTSVKDIVLGYFDYGRGTRILDKLLRSWENVKIRSLGCASMEIVYVALGYADVFIDVRGWLRNVDVATAIGIAKETGAIVVDTNGNTINAPIINVVKIGELIVSQNKEIIKKILDIVKNVT